MNVLKVIVYLFLIELNFILLIILGNTFQNNLVIDASVEKLLNLGYNIEEVVAIKDNDLVEIALNSDYCNQFMAILNDGNYNSDYLKNYLNNCNSHDVTTNSHDVTTINIIELLKKEKYYIPDRLDRYLAYYNDRLSSKEVVTNVNCNIDFPFYSEYKNSDLTKGNLILVNKYYKVTSDFVPKKLIEIPKSYSMYSGNRINSDVYVYFKKLIDDASKINYQLHDISSYRPYAYQNSLYNTRVSELGKAGADSISARPGYSEHHTGLATDILKVGSTMNNFANTKEAKWLADNAHNYGFIVRYPEGKEYLTGYSYEPWHLRYVGENVAKYIYDNNIVFEEYYAYYCEYKNEC